jgi:hypothetical protein
VETREGLNEGIERLNKKKTKSIDKSSKTNAAEPYFYVALVLKGTEKQYLNLLKYVNNRNGARIIYQCKSLTYLRITREDHAQLQEVTADTVGIKAYEAE